MASDARSLPLFGQDPHALAGVHLVGRYALGVDWQDRHSSIYPFEHLRAACACAECGAAEPAGPPPAAGTPATWPVEIAREGTGLRIRWQDGHETRLGGPELRRLCRCALCTGGH